MSRRLGWCHYTLPFGSILWLGESRWRHIFGSIFLYLQRVSCINVKNVINMERFYLMAFIESAKRYLKIYCFVCSNDGEREMLSATYATFSSTFFEVFSGFIVPLCEEDVGRRRINHSFLHVVIWHAEGMFSHLLSFFHAMPRIKWSERRQRQEAKHRSMGILRVFFDLMASLLHWPFMHSPIV